MKRNFFSLLNTILGGAFFCIVLASCENFMTGGDVRKEIEAAIAEANAAKIEVTVKPDEGTGTSIPYGLYETKVGKTFKISFTENKQYSFKKWKAVFLSNGTEVTDGIQFEDVYSLETKVTVLTKESIKIYPECVERISIQGEVSPKYDPSGVSRDRPILVRFSKPVAPESFIFSSDELEQLPEDAVPNKTLAGEEEVVYSYTITEESGTSTTYFKNIQITDEYGYSMAAHFLSPVVEDTLLTIPINKNNPIVFGEKEEKKVLKVVLNSSIYGTNGIAPMLEDKAWNYIITPETDEKAIVEFRCDTTFGTNSKTFSIGSKIPVSFIESGDIKFVKWIYDTSVLDVDDETQKDAVFLVKEKTTEHGVVVTAETRITGKLSSIKPEDVDNGVSNNTAIEIEFNKPMDKASVVLGDSIIITETYDKSIHFESYFENPIWNGNTCKIKPKFEIKDLLKSSTDLKNLMITLDAKKIKDETGETILEEDYTHVYRINHLTETLPPEFTLAVYKPKLDSNYELVTDNWGRMTYESLTDKTFEAFKVTENQSTSNPNGDFSKNHIKDTIYFDYSATDEESGFEKLTVKETWLSAYTYEYDYDEHTWEEAKIIYPIKLNKTTSTGNKIEYKLQSVQDGIVKLEFIFTDRAGNESKKEIYVLKDTTLLDNSLKTEEMTAIGTQDFVLTYTVDGKEVSLPAKRGAVFTATGLAQIEALMPPVRSDEEPPENLEDIDKVEQTLTFYYANVKDVYAYNDQSLSTVNLNYKVLYGESEDEDSLTEAECELLDNKQRVRFTFPRNIKKDCFIKITVTDCVGNTRTETRIIPGRLSIMGDKYNSSSFAYGNYHEIKLGRYDEFARLINTYTDASYGFYYFFPNDDDEHPYKIIVSGQGSAYIENHLPRFYLNYKYNDEGINIPTKDFAPYDIYECYLLPFYKYGTQFYYGTISKGYYYYLNSNTTVPTFTGAALPASVNDFNCDLDPSISNLGYRTGHITFNEGEDSYKPTEGYEYGIKYIIGDNESKSGYSGLDFSLPSGNEYNIYIYAQSPDGKRIVSSVCQTADATYDNIPPEMEMLTAETQRYRGAELHGPDMTKIFITDDSSILRFFPHDNTGIKSVAGKPGYCEFEYCITPYIGDMVFLTNEDFEARRSTGGVYKVEYAEGTESVILDLHGFYYQSNSVITFKVQDNFNNYFINNININLSSSFNMNVLNGITIKNGWDYINSSTGVHGEIDTLWISCYTNIITFGLKDDNWKYIKRASNILRHNMSEVEQNIYDNCVFMSCVATPTGTNSCSLYSDMNYICKEYELKRIDGEDMDDYCKNKGVIPAYGGGYQIFYDAPCFAHTMAFPTDQLDYLEGLIQSHWNFKEYQIWDTVGREYGVKVLNDDFSSGTTTYYAPVDEIPSGYSYVTIVHFADRTAVMGEVKHKP